MMRKALLVVFVALFVVSLTSLGFAYTVKVASGYGPYNYDRGGEFTLKPGDGLEWVLSGYASVAKNVPSYPGTFQSFCLEKDEYIYEGQTYDVTLNTAAVHGGLGGPDPDPLSRGAAYLYYNFAKGTLDGYEYLDTTGRLASAGALQNAIWYLEQEISLSNPLNNVFLAAVYDYFGDSWTTAKSDNQGLFPVLVANLRQWDSSKCAWIDKQDQLVVTPIPGALYLLGAGLVGLVGIRRRMQV